MTLEGQVIQWLMQKLPTSDELAVGLGDDAAVIRRAAGNQVVTTDLLSDDIDFLVDEVSPGQIGHKALGVNLSDLAAMAARPQAVVVSLLLPNAGSRLHSALELAIGIYEGMLPLADSLDVTIAGGDTNAWEGKLAISITALGETTELGPLTRSGGQPGDRLLVTGRLGGSILGRHLDVEPRISEALVLHELYKLNAGIDISDGLSLDASRLAEASRLGAVMDLSAIPLSEAAHEMSRVDGRSAVDHALSDGEDFELLLAVPPAEADCLLRDQPLDVPITCIGELIEQPGLWQREAGGQTESLEPRGWEHGTST
ncbi:MAG: thiamine-phosphate kinase [Planctomycetota bacterium]